MGDGSQVSVKCDGRMYPCSWILGLRSRRANPGGGTKMLKHPLKVLRKCLEPADYVVVNQVGMKDA